MLADNSRNTIVHVQNQTQLASWYLNSTDVKKVYEMTLEEITNILVLKMFKKSLKQKSFSFRGAKLWKELGCEAKITSSCSAFKKAVTRTKMTSWSFISFSLYLNSLAWYKS